MLMLIKDALGASLEEICKIVPNGALVFFPSYKLLEKLHDRWCQTGQWDRLNAQKPIFVGKSFNEYVKSTGDLQVHLLHHMFIIMLWHINLQ